MTELTMERLKENLESLKMKNTLEILDNYLERAVKDELNIVEVLDHIFAGVRKAVIIPGLTYFEYTAHRVNTKLCSA